MSPRVCSCVPGVVWWLCAAGILLSVSRPSTASRYNIQFTDVYAWLDTMGIFSFGRLDTRPNSTPQFAQADTNKVFVEIAEVREIDDDGNPILSDGHTHEFGDKNEFNFKLLSGGYKSFSSIGVKLESKMEGSMRGFSGAVHLMVTPGNITDRYTIIESIKKGDIKLSFAFEGWDWCVACAGDRTGSGIELVLLMTSRERVQVGVSNDAHVTATLSGGGTLSLPSVVLIDEERISMTRGFPQITNEGDKDQIVIRFPKFQKRASYDVTLRPGVRGYPPTTTTSTTSTTSTTTTTTTTPAPTTTAIPSTTVAPAPTSKLSKGVISKYPVHKLPSDKFANDKVKVHASDDLGHEASVATTMTINSLLFAYVLYRCGSLLGVY